MTNSKALFDELVKAIRLEDSPAEISTLAFMALEKWGVTKSDMVARKNVELRLSDFSNLIARINQGEPIQYILGEAWFYGRKFMVNPSVLIPRPETEGLVRLALEEIGAGEKKVIDIGTGSGCIAITLALENPGLQVTASDVSESALGVAQQNAIKLKAGISLVQHDILKDQFDVSCWDVVISNPPYISMDEMHLLRENVLKYEPGIALFGPGNDPLAFFKSIACQARKGLRKEGLLLMEINERFPDAVADILSSAGYNSISVLKDLNNKARFVRGRQPKH